MTRIVQGSLVTVGLAICLSMGCAVPQAPGKGMLRLLREKSTKREYWLYLPDEYVAQLKRGVKRPAHPTTDNKLWPLVVSFHGMKPFDNCLPQAQEWQQESDRYGFVMIAPQLMTSDLFMEFPLNHVRDYVKRDEQCSLAIMQEVMEHLPVDRARVLSTSWSSGGYLAHYMMNRHPELFSCLAVRQSNFSAGILDPRQVPKYRDKPIGVFWTQNDFAICQIESRKAVEWYQRHGFKDLSWGVFAGMGHERTPQSAAAMFAIQCGIRPRSPATFARLVETYGRTGKVVAHGLQPAPRSLELAEAPEQTPSGGVETPRSPTRREPIRTDTTSGLRRADSLSSQRPGASGEAGSVSPARGRPGGTKPPDMAWSGGIRREEAPPMLSTGQSPSKEPERARGDWMSQPSPSKPYARRPTAGEGGQPTQVTASPVRVPPGEGVTPARTLPGTPRTEGAQQVASVAPRGTNGQGNDPTAGGQNSTLKPPVQLQRHEEEPPVVAPPRITVPQRDRNEMPARTVARVDQGREGGVSSGFASSGAPLPGGSGMPAPTVVDSSAGKRKAEATPVQVIVSRSVGISPCYVSFRVVLPAGEGTKADFLWTDNGVPICNDPTGGKVLMEPGEHRIEVLVITANDQELRGGQTVQVLEKPKGPKRPTPQYGAYP